LFVCIVSDVAGTTRDTIEIRTEWNGNLVILEDTAGIRHTHDIIEEQGIARSLQSAKVSDICLLLYSDDAEKSGLFDLEIPGQRIFVKTKIDQDENKVCEDLNVSIFDIETIHYLKKELSMIVSRICNIGDTIIGYERHRQDLNNALNVLRAITTTPNFRGVFIETPEVLVELLKDSLTFVSSIISLPDTEDILGEIFSNFCIGK